MSHVKKKYLIGLIFSFLIYGLLQFVTILQQKLVLAYVSIYSDGISFKRVGGVK